MSDSKQGVTVHVGKDAIERFLACLHSYFDDDATGKAYVVHRCSFSEMRMAGMTMCRTEAIAFALSNPESIAELDQYEMIVIDSGNSSGDSWIATFYPRQRVMTFVDQMMALHSRAHGAPAALAAV
jgi:hypothetical protein